MINLLFILFTLGSVTNNYTFVGDGGCRTETNINYPSFAVSYFSNLQECKTHCDSYSNCTGIEWFTHNGKCQLQSKPNITHCANNNDFTECYIKNNNIYRKKIISRIQIDS